MEKLDETCDCPTCKAGWTRGKLRALMKSQDNAERQVYYNLASQHNLRFIIRLTEEARESVVQGNFEAYRDEFLKNYYHEGKSESKC